MHDEREAARGAGPCTSGPPTTAGTYKYQLSLIDPRDKIVLPAVPPTQDAYWQAATVHKQIEYNEL